MQNPELSISVGDLIGVPRVTLRGSLDGWHDEAISGILQAFREQDTTSLVLDLVGLRFAGTNGATSMVNALRSLGPGMGIHVVASGTPANILRRAKLGNTVRLYSSTDEIAQYLSPGEDALTSRWVARSSDDAELPLAA